MLLNYWNAAIRFFGKNWSITTLNVVVFGVGLAACVLIFNKVSYELSYDKFYDNHENIYRVALDHYFPYDAYQNSTALSFYPIGEELMNEYPEVINATRVSPKRSNTTIRVNDDIFQEDDVCIVNPSFFKVFSLEFIAGDTVGMGAADVFLSESLATKLYGRSDVAGLSIDLWGGNVMKIKGVFKDIPDNTHVNYELLLSVPFNKNRMSDWQYYSLHTYITLEDGTDIDALRDKLSSFSTKFSKLSDEQSGVDYRWEIQLQPLTSIYLESDLEFEHQINGDLQSVYLLMIMAFLIVVISCFNYVNLTNSMYAKRFLEFFIRKVHGATVMHLLKQYAFESLLLLVVGFALAVGLLVVMPYISSYSLTNLGAQSQFFYVGIVGIVLVSFLLSVVLPSSAFAFINPLKFANGEFVSNPVMKRLGRSLIILQFVVSFLLLAGSLTISKQLNFITDRSPGITIDNVVTLKLPGINYNNNSGDLNQLKNDLEKNVSIKSVSFSYSSPGNKHSWDGSIRFIDEPTDNAKLNYILPVTSGFFETYKVPLLAGRIFNERLPADSAAILINETMAKDLTPGDYQDLIGRKVVMPWNNGYPTFEIIGVTRDYYHESLKNEVSACAFMPATNNGYINDVSIRLSSSSADGLKSTLSLIESSFKKIFPSNVYKMVFVEDNYSGQFNSYFELSNLIKALAFLAILLAGVGLFGLASNETAKRTKEVAIRKVNGAQGSDIYLLFLKYFGKLVGLAFLISVPFSFYFANDWLDKFAVRIGMGAWFFVFQVIIIVVVGIISVGYFLVKMSMQNPIHALRNRND